MKPVHFTLLLYLLFAGIIYATDYGKCTNGRIIIHYKNFEWSYPCAPEQVVEEYCTYDAEGNIAELPSEAFWNIMAMFTDWDERGLSTNTLFYNTGRLVLPKITLIKCFKIIKFNSKGFSSLDTSKVTMEFSIVGHVINDSIRVQADSETREFILVKKENRWKICRNESMLYLRTEALKRINKGEYFKQLKGNTDSLPGMNRYPGSDNQFGFTVLTFTYPTAIPGMENKVSWSNPADPARTAIAYLSMNNSAIYGWSKPVIDQLYGMSSYHDSIKSSSDELKYRKLDVFSKVLLIDSLHLGLSECTSGEKICRIPLEYAKYGYSDSQGDTIFRSSSLEKHVIAMLKKGNLWTIIPNDTLLVERANVCQDCEESSVCKLCK